PSTRTSTWRASACGPRPGPTRAWSSITCCSSAWPEGPEGGARGRISGKLRMRIARVLTRLNLGGPARQALASDPLLAGRGHELRIFAGESEPGEGDLAPALRARGLDVRKVAGL